MIGPSFGVEISGRGIVGEDSGVTITPTLGVEFGGNGVPLAAVCSGGITTNGMKMKRLSWAVAGSAMAASESRMNAITLASFLFMG